METRLAFLWAPGPAPDAISSGMRAQVSLALRAVPSDLCELLPLLTDSHCHIFGIELTEAALAAQLSNVLMRIGHAKQYLFMSVKASDWDVIMGQAWARGVDAARVRVGFGVHPRWAQTVAPGVGFEQKLTDCLSNVPRAIVGEIGLDRSKRFKHFFDSHQLPLFRAQLRIAASMSRPVSIHCVKADAGLVQTFHDSMAVNGDGLPPAICLHSFAGSFETLNRIISIVEGNRRKSSGCGAGKETASAHVAPRVFVGFNAWTNLYKKGAGDFVRQLVSDTASGEVRMLIESDFDFPVYQGSCPRDADKILMNGVAALSEMLGLEPVAVVHRLAENTRVFLRTLAA